MDSILIFFLFVLLLTICIFLFLLYQKIQKNAAGDASMAVMSKWMEQMQLRLDRNADVLERSMRATNDTIGSRLDKTSDMLNVVGQRVGEMSEIGRSMRDLGDLLKSPKLRGNIGEYVLRDLLSQYLPKASFAMQYAFKSGYIADAIIRTDQGILCIDSKFPLENFRKMYELENEVEKDKARRDFIRDVRRHIDAIAMKYIVPEERSLDYAIMYVPSESIYYEVICQQHELLEYAQGKQVIIVSPSVFYAYLQVILLSLEGRKVEEQALELMRNFRGLQLEFKRFSETFGLGMKHLSNARNAFDDASIKYHVVEGKLQSMFKEEEKLITDSLPQVQKYLPE
ncbi:MAG: DNA recombination protein RmuC [bacterium]|nr:DNA recombination protein RmuC [bacterium]